MVFFEKVVASFLTPPGLFILLLIPLLVYLLRRECSQIIRGLVVFTVVFMFVSFTGLGVRLFVIPLEREFHPARTAELPEKELPVVVLGGGIKYISDGYTDITEAALQRLTRGYMLRRQLDTPLVITGGPAVGRDGIGEAEAAREWLLQMGENDENIVLENRARNTFENALYIREWLQETEYDAVYLVTSAVHMRRSQAVFSARGIEVIEVPAGYAYSHRLQGLDYLPSSGAFSANMRALHEWLGLFWYKIRGRI